MAMTCFTRQRCRLPPIRDDFRGLQSSKKPSEKRPGVVVWKTRKKAQNRDRTKRIVGITGRGRTTKSIAATSTAGTRLGQRDTAKAVVSRALDRKTRSRQNHQSGHTLGKAWPWQVQSHSGQLYLLYGIRRKAEGGRWN
ncbi:hypothetical protein NDU88_005349 [Pleurodeles waltl]|uniref:Uncharacterized protein n=1 Tax=Pleurodeles waltl TaxID=8319 RepID=A0AAV7MY38_PLEWA|nr:hypothetical protein NDU88_005349 [Pleurodeles waltl]